MTPISQAGIFLCRALFDFAIMFMLLRFTLPFSAVRPHNPLTQVIMRLTNPLVLRTRRLIKPFRRIDIASLVWIIAFGTLKTLCLVGILTGTTTSLEILMLWTAGDLLSSTLMLYFYLIMGSVLLSWVVQDPHHPVAEFMHQTTEPLIGPMRRRLPAMGGLDLSPLPVILGLQLLVILVANPISQTAMHRLVS